MSTQDSPAVPRLDSFGTTPLSIVRSHFLQSAWWSSVASLRLGDATSHVTRREEDVDLGKEPIATLRRAVKEGAPDLTFVGGNYFASMSNEVLYTGSGGLVLMLGGDDDHLSATVWSADFELADKLARAVLAAVPRKKRAERAESMPFTFWFCEPKEAQVEHDLKNIDCPLFSEIEGNYPARIRMALKSLLSHQRPEAGGKIVLWFGPPGTGKTYAVRALAREWATRLGASIEVVLDPEKMFGSTWYMHKVLLSDSHSLEVIKAAKRRLHAPAPEDTTEPNPFRLIILEDAAELFSNECRTTQGFARFLNLTEGIIGQGLRCVFLLTANEEVGRIDPALTRHGRCLQSLEFPAMDEREARAWLDREGCSGKPVKGPMTLSELFALRSAMSTPAATTTRLGF